MPPTQILSLKPNVTEPEALRMFSSFGFGKLYWTLLNGPLQRVAPMYVPFSLYRASYRMNRANVSRWLALDAVDGSLDPFEFPRVPSEDQLLSVETRNTLPAHLDPALAAQRLRDKVLRLIFQQGFFKLRDMQLEITREPLEFHVPYWLAFHATTSPGTLASAADGRGTDPPAERVRCRVLDAVRRKFEGAKASAFFEHWLAQ